MTYKLHWFEFTLSCLNQQFAKWMPYGPNKTNIFQGTKFC